MKLFLIITIKMLQYVILICSAFAECCLRCLEDLIRTLNYNAIIVMTVTG